MKFLLALTLSVAVHLLALNFLAGVGHFSSQAQETRHSGFPVTLKATLIIDSGGQELSQTIESLHKSEVVPAPNLRVEKPGASPAEHSPIPINIYHLRTELTRQPHLVSNVDLSPMALLYPRASGAYVVELYINERGNIDDVVSLSKDLDTSAFKKLRELLMQLTFTGGEIAGKPVKTRYKIEVLFSNATSEKNNEIPQP